MEPDLPNAVVLLKCWPLPAAPPLLNKLSILLTTSLTYFPKFDLFIRSLRSADKFDRFDETEAVSEIATFVWFLILVIVVSKDLICWHRSALVSGEDDGCCCSAAM